MEYGSWFNGFWTFWWSERNGFPKKYQMITV
jgi:hypothetical protein